MNQDRLFSEKLHEIYKHYHWNGYHGKQLYMVPFRPVIRDFMVEVLRHFELPSGQGFEKAFVEMARHPVWCDEVYCITIREFKTASEEYKKAIKPGDEAPGDHRKQEMKETVFLSSELVTRYATFYKRFRELMEDNHVHIQLLSNTNDIWCRDFMPVKISGEKYVQFTYDPDYLKGAWADLRTDPAPVTRNLNLDLVKSPLVIDGGNVIMQDRTVVLTDKIFRENPKRRKTGILDEIQKILEVDKVVVIPTEPDDFTGHADGMVRFVGPDTVIINDYLWQDGYSRTFIEKLRRSLAEAGMSIAGTLPYRSFQRKNKHGDFTALGCYMNFLEMNDLVILPAFALEEDEVALNKCRAYFPSKKVVQVDAREIAEDGGVLNCISWIK